MQTPFSTSLQKIRYLFFKQRLRKYVRSLYGAEDPWSSETLAQFLSPSFQKVMEARRLKEEHLSPVLDVGGGEGHFYPWFQKADVDYHLLDLEKRALLRAKERYGAKKIRLIHKSIDCFQAKPETYQVILLLNVLTYLGADKHPEVFQRIIQHLWQSLRSGGLIFLAHPYYTESEMQKIGQYADLFTQSGARKVAQEHLPFGKQNFLWQVLEKKV